MPRDASRRNAPRKDSPRLDAFLVEKGLVESRARAQALIMAGAVRVDGEVVTKAGSPGRPGLRARRRSPRESSFVSRAGEKLDHALDAFGIQVEGRHCIDAGASTGGFTDVAAQAGGATGRGGGCRLRPARLVLEAGPARRGDGADQRALPLRARTCRSRRISSSPTSPLSRSRSRSEPALDGAVHPRRR